MTRRRKQVRRPSGPGRPVIQNLRVIGEKFGHPLLSQEIENMRQREGESDVQRMICFGRIPACVWSAKGIGNNDSQAEESAAHAMLDFFRLAISPEFVRLFQGCVDDDALNPLLPQLSVVFENFEKAIASDYLLITRCSQFDMTSAALLRGREVKKRVLLNLRDSSVGYASDSKISSSSDHKIETEKQECDIVTLDDEDIIGSTAENSRSPSSNSDCIIIENDIKDSPKSSSGNRPKSPVRPQIIKQMKRSPSIKQKSSSTSPQRMISPGVQKLRDLDRAQRDIIEGQRDQNNATRRNNLDSDTYFGQLNASKAGPPEVFCCLPISNRTQYREAQSSDESEDEGERAIPRKRAKVNNYDDDIVVLMTTSSQGSGAPGVSSGETLSSPDKLLKDSDGDEIGDIIDEWNEADDSGDMNGKTVESPEKHSEVTTTTDIVRPRLVDKGFYDGHSSHESFIKSRELPYNYQAKTIGVVVNEYMCRQVEKYVDSVTAKYLDCVEDVGRKTWIHYMSNTQDDTIYNLKLRARECLLSELKKVFPERSISLHITGSTVNGCGSFNSDMDMCLCYPTHNFKGHTFEDYHCDKANSVKILRKVDKALRKSAYRSGIRKLIDKWTVIPAKVPIIKCVTSREAGTIDMDINVNNIAGIYNSHLMHYYSLIDVRFPAIALFIKHWAANAGIANAPDGFLNSYTIILMVIHFLQCGVTPAVLPNLQYLFPDKFDRKLPLEELRLFGDIAEQIPTTVPNPISIGELIVGFFYYYSHFDFQNQAISIRSAQVVDRVNLPKNTSTYAIFIEEPFDAVNTARCVRGTAFMNSIKKEFRKASNTFSTKRRFSVADIDVVVREI